LIDWLIDWLAGWLAGWLILSHLLVVLSAVMLWIE